MIADLLKILAGGVKIYDLSQPLMAEAPSSPNHTDFSMALTQRHGDTIREDGSSNASELIVTSGHVGTHVDGLAHFSHNGKLYGDVPADNAQQGGRFSVHGIEDFEPVLARGVLLDVAAVHSVSVLPGGYGVTGKDLEEAAKRSEVTVQPGDTVLIHSGWANNFDDHEAFLGSESGLPGSAEDAAHWLAERGIRAAGSETTAFEQIKPDVGYRLLPVHRLLLVEYGVNIIEAMNLSELVEDNIFEFLFVLSPLKIVGATGSPVRPLAAVPGSET